MAKAGGSVHALGTTGAAGSDERIFHPPISGEIRCTTEGGNMSGLTRQHFTEIAASLKRVRPGKDDPEYKQWREDVSAIAAACAKFNPGFNRARFLEAAGADE